MTRKRVSLFFLAAMSVVLVWAIPAGAQSKAAKVTKVTVTAGKPTEFRFTLSKKVVPHGVVTFVVTNKGTLPHDFKILGKDTGQLSPGKHKSLTVTFKKKGNYPYICTLPGHAAAGMKGVLKVT